MSIQAPASAWWLGIALLALPANVAAQGTGASTDAGRVYVGASLISTTRPAGQPDYICCTPMFGGTTAGIGGTIGFLIGPHVSFAVEGSWVGTLSGPFGLGHLSFAEHSTATETETMIGLLLRGHPMTSRVRVEPVGGMFMAIESITLTDRQYIQIGYLTRTVSASPDVSTTSLHFGFGAGADVVVDLTRTLAVTGSFRYARFWDRYVQPATMTDGQSVGIGNNTFQVAGGLRWTFR
jgi:hypothetical protein